MTDKLIRRTKQLAIQVPCEYCRAEPGDPCDGVRGLGNVHHVRWIAAKFLAAKELPE